MGSLNSKITLLLCLGISLVIHSPEIFAGPPFTDPCRDGGDEDLDGDGLDDECDNCPTVAINDDQSDTDVDEIGKVCDNCPCYFNPDQADEDGDGDGDICEPDDPHFCPTCYRVGPDCPTLDDCRDGGDEDSDHDIIDDECDNCPAMKNISQQDADGDTIGTACDICPYTFNPRQNPTDINADGIPDECEADLFLQMTATRVTSGNYVRYRVKVKNLGPGPSIRVSVSGIPPAQLKFFRGSSTCAGSPTFFECTRSIDLPPNGEWSLYIDAQPRRSDESLPTNIGGRIQAETVSAGGTVDPNYPGNNRATAVVPPPSTSPPPAPVLTPTPKKK